MCVCGVQSAGMDKGRAGSKVEPGGAGGAVPRAPPQGGSGEGAAGTHAGHPPGAC